MDAVRDGLACDDANVTPESHSLFVTGDPGTGKTEVILQCALNATSDTTKVLIACPIGPLVAAYRKRIPPHTNIVVETIQSSFKITRKTDEVFIPPGRLLHLIIFDEASQQDAHVWDQVRTALAELTPHQGLSLYLFATSTHCNRSMARLRFRRHWIGKCQEVACARCSCNNMQQPVAPTRACLTS